MKIYDSSPYQNQNIVFQEDKKRWTIQDDLQCNQSYFSGTSWAFKLSTVLSFNLTASVVMDQQVSTILMWPWSVRMDILVMEKCLAFFQGLVQSNNKFSFNFSCGKDTFNFDNKELVHSSWKEKKSQSQLRREKMRREIRMMNQELTEKVPAKVISGTLKFKCTQCETSFRELNKGIKYSHW